MRKRAGRKGCHLALITLCTSWQCSGKSSSLLSHPLSTGMGGPASSSLFPSSALWRLWLGTWPPILAAPSVSKTPSLLWCSWPSAPLFQVQYVSVLSASTNGWLVLGFLWGFWLAAGAAARAHLCNLCLHLCCQSNCLESYSLNIICKLRKVLFYSLGCLDCLIAQNAATERHKREYKQSIFFSVSPAFSSPYSQTVFPLAGLILLSSTKICMSVMKMFMKQFSPSWMCENSSILRSIWELFINVLIHA